MGPKGAAAHDHDPTIEMDLSLGAASRLMLKGDSEEE